MAQNRTAARGILAFLIVAAAFTAEPLAARTDAAPRVPQLIFPVVGPVQYRDDFGEPRGQGSHEGNDIMAPRRAVAVAAEEGRVRFWTTSARAGCMLYLEGQSGTTYLYVHLNNDLRGDDNRGKCVAGVAYAHGLENGAKVSAGQPIAFVGDSGDAEEASPHLHFEVHPWGGGAVSPYQHLRRARKLLLAATPGKPFTAALRGTVVNAFEGSLTLDVEQVTSWPGSLRVKGVGREVELSVPPETLVFDPVGGLIAAAELSALEAGQKAVAWTGKATATLDAALGLPLALATEKVELG
jgi:murein DD-endopeptidase MepM/ murein hydrolase activator NlpD